MAMKLFYNIEFVYDDEITGSDKRFTIYNLTSERLKVIRENTFASGLFVGSIDEDKTKFVKPTCVGVIIPPHRIRYANLFLVVGNDEKKEDEKK